ncbi:hypothetical protein RRG08_009987 [Elysia crispata]|uniref:Uncharacterized protein n=1 Tax=Elysia crispata TaxID=231223 RepID=A0AAE1B4G6_9GAST|nr:hypothetical protein RRG08_009987 [Elysia crispata]
MSYFQKNGKERSSLISKDDDFCLEKHSPNLSRTLDFFALEQIFLEFIRYNACGEHIAWKEYMSTAIIFTEAKPLEETLRSRTEHQLNVRIAK